MINLFKKTKTNNAFTLAEVLITLSIIGVVAAMTIPVISEKIQDWQFKQAAKEAFSKASQAVQQLRIENGGTLNSYHGVSNSFKPDFMKYFKVAKNCASMSCVTRSYDPTEISYPLPFYKALNGNDFLAGNLTDDGQFVTTDGMFWMFENSIVSNLYITVDVNGYNKGPNTIGRDTFVFQVLNSNLYPMGATGTYYPASTYCNRNNSNRYQGMACMSKVMEGIDY